MTFLEGVWIYWTIGTLVSILYHWTDDDVGDGIDMLLDFILWPYLIYLAFTDHNG